MGAAALILYVLSAILIVLGVAAGISVGYASRAQVDINAIGAGIGALVMALFIGGLNTKLQRLIDLSEMRVASESNEQPANQSTASAEDLLNDIPDVPTKAWLIKKRQE